ncbi:probable RNA polymerase sigma-H factor [Lentisphaera araneosa HTCC2155]|jgi:RNA polymerase sigma factor (sigma-70 family)|uniref:RNA polymerase sigma factor SigS n=1 Tax=Lentisphaera araneosa HTCC2155 TaxID=313628 RepID=A6DPC3_9BACT|nr:RNA polymerase sigma factor [Lentisphaera araneosa]EDM26419.1 probable RNA polymerase sigma-H factor [Lentisphaera araneosa HTCC2155]
MSNEWVTRQTLLLRAKNPDDHQAWEEFISYYKDFIQVLIYKLRFSGKDTDDLTQMILLSLWKDLAKYDKEKASFRNWMGAVIRNTTLNYYRKQANQAKRDAEKMNEYIDSTPPSELDLIIEKEWKSYICDLAFEKMKSLFSGNAIDVFDLSMQGLSSEEIAEKLNLKKDSVYVLKNRVKKKFMDEVRVLVTQLEY